MVCKDYKFEEFLFEEFYPNLCLYFQNLMFPKRDYGRFSVDEIGTLRIRQVRFEDAGEYTCHAYNAAGSKDKKVHITVRGK